MVWIFSSQVFDSSIPHSRRPWNTVPELEFWVASSKPSDSYISWDYVILVFLDYVPDCGFRLKAVCDISMTERRFISAHMDFVILNFSFDFYTILWDFDKKKFLMLVCLDQIWSVRCFFT